MKRLVLFFLLVIFGVFVYYASFRGMVIWPLLVAELLLVGIYYIITALVTEKMIRKVRGNEEFFFVRASLISEDGTALTQGALTVTQSDVVFYTRKEAKGGVKVVWSCTVPEISEYTIGKVNDHQKGLMLTLNGSETPVKFVSSPITKQESAFRKALGWDS